MPTHGNTVRPVEYRYLIAVLRVAAVAGCSADDSWLRDKAALLGAAIKDQSSGAFYLAICEYCVAFIYILVGVCIYSLSLSAAPYANRCYVFLHGHNIVLVMLGPSFWTISFSIPGHCRGRIITCIM